MTADKYKKAVYKLKEWSERYYNGNPIATDNEFDKLQKEVKEFELNNPSLLINNSTTQTIGIDSIKNKNTNKHLTPMWSMEDIFTYDELVNWFNKRKVLITNFICMKKFDGLSLNITYENGRIKTLSTRGNGKEGEDVTHLINVIKNIPTTIKEKRVIEIRGECIIEKETFKKINQKRKNENKKLFSNPRALVSGTLAIHNMEIVKERNVIFIPWGLGKNSLNLETYNETMITIKDNGFEIPHYVKDCFTIEHINSIYKKMIKDRSSLQTVIDGMVIRADNLKQFEECGYTNKYPKGMVAFKFPADESTTTVEGVDNQIGRSGKLTPVLLLTPVKIGGVTIRKVTVFNYDFITKMDICIGDKVIISRSGDVIPKLTTVLKERRDGNEYNIKKPLECPYCGTKLKNIDKNIFCLSETCPEKTIARVKYFSSRNVMDIKGMGDKVIRKLVISGLVKDVSDIYELTINSLINCGFGKKTSESLISKIKNSRGNKLELLITGLSIPLVSNSVAKEIVSIYGLAFVEEINFDNNTLSKRVNENLRRYIHTNKDMIKKLINEIRPVY